MFFGEERSVGGGIWNVVVELVEWIGKFVGGGGEDGLIVWFWWMDVV